MSFSFRRAVKLRLRCGFNPLHRFIGGFLMCRWSASAVFTAFKEEAGA